MRDIQIVELAIRRVRDELREEFRNGTRQGLDEGLQEVMTLLADEIYRLGKEYHD